MLFIIYNRVIFWIRNIVKVNNLCGIFVKIYICMYIIFIYNKGKRYKFVGYKYMIIYMFKSYYVKNNVMFRFSFVKDVN